MDSVLTIEQRKLVEELRSAFADSHEWVDADVDAACDRDDAPVHHEGCGCNALIPLSKYDAARERFMTAFAVLTEIEVPPADRGVAILEDPGDELSCVHVCAPYCPKCGRRLTAEGAMRFHGALIDREGWHDTDGMGDIETECSDVDGWCCDCETTVGLYFCYGDDETCAKEAACPGTTTGGQSDGSSMTATTDSPEHPPAHRVATPEGSGEGGDASSENGSNSDRGYVPVVGWDVP